jgi:hypothetical protein
MSLLRRAEGARRPGGRQGYDRKRANRISLQFVLVVAIAYAAYMALQLSSDPARVVGSELRVRSLFGYRLQLASIRELDLEKAPLAEAKRIFGNDAFGLFREGDYELPGLGKARVFLKRPNLSYLTFRTDEANYALSLGSPEKDQLLYNAMKLGMK